MIRSASQPRRACCWRSRSWRVTCRQGLPVAWILWWHYAMGNRQKLVTALMLANAALFLFGAIQHSGVAIGSLHEPVIIPASIVETLCALALIWGAVAVLTGSPKARRAA